MILLFWLSLICLFYIYIGYPILLRFLPKKKSEKQSSDNVKKNTEHFFPTITIIIPAFNEEDVIASTIENKLAQVYPQDKINIIVVSDESEDDTDNIITRLADKNDNVKLIRQIPRKGKTSGLNLAFQEITSDLIVFSDANSIYELDAIKQLADTFIDPDVGYVTGKMIYVNEDGSMVGEGCSAYMQYENYMRSLESHIGSVVGVDGGIDAIRTSLYSELNSDQLPDFVQPLKVVEQGKRVVYQPKAVLKEEALADNNSEFKMRVRVSLRALWALYDMRSLFNPANYGLFSLQLFSHKLIRYLAFIPMISAFIANAMLVGYSSIYSLLFLGQIVFYILAYIGYKQPNNTNKYIGLAHYFCLINYAAAIASVKFFKGEKIVIWKPRQG
jgi:cellulose synthase/poly-beta-1,6-N-acetylglucosamine synthase-like glycosyltransferase